MSVTTAVGPILQVDGASPTAPFSNLFDVADPLAGRWLAGVSIWPYTPATASGIDPCATGTFRVKDEGEGFTSPTFHAFSAYVPIICSTLTRDYDGLESRARAALDASDHFPATQQLVAALYAANPALADAPDKPNGNTATAPQAALSHLEQAIGGSGRKGVLHADPATAAAWSYSGALRIVSNHLETYQGTPVSVGGGYADLHPDDVGAPAAGSSWAWASGPIQAGRADLIVSDELSDYIAWSTNEFIYRAERSIVVGWDGIFSASVLVDWTP